MTLNASKSRLCQKALRIISQRACDGLTVKDMLRELHVSRLALEREFAAHVGKTPGQMLKESRLARARELLTTTQLPIKRIAQAVGYVKASNFGDFFRAQTGQLPQEYRSGRRHRTHSADPVAKPSESRRALPGTGMLGIAANGAHAGEYEQFCSGAHPLWLGWNQMTGADAKSVTILLAPRQFGGYDTAGSAVFAAAFKGTQGENNA